MNTRRVIFIILAIIWVIVIFSFSSADGDESEDISTGFGGKLCKIFVRDFEKLSSVEQEALIDKINYPIRKIAHFTEYAVLGFFLAGALVPDIRVINKNRLCISFLLGVLYAITDELHQLFVADRSGRVLDVFIDSCGVITAVLLFALLQKLMFLPKNNAE